MGIFSIDLDFCKHVKLDIIAFDKFFDLTVSPWLLTSKLITREGQDTEALSSIPEDMEFGW